MGFVLAKSDIIKSRLDFKRNTNVDAEYLVPIDDRKFQSSDVVILIDMDFTEKLYSIYYFNFVDIMGIIGGLNASIGPALGFIAPLFILNYLY